MTANVGGIDRAVRILVGLALLSLLAWYPGEAKWFGLIGLIPLGTGLMGYCPLYSLFGINTCPAKRA